MHGGHTFCVFHEVPPDATAEWFIKHVVADATAGCCCRCVWNNESENNGKCAVFPQCGHVNCRSERERERRWWTPKQAGESRNTKQTQILFIHSICIFTSKQTNINARTQTNAPTHTPTHPQPNTAKRGKGVNETVRRRLNNAFVVYFLN